MSACFDKIRQNIVDYERDVFHSVVEIYEYELQNSHVIKASERMDKIILNWYAYQKIDKG